MIDETEEGLGFVAGVVVGVVAGVAVGGGRGFEYIEKENGGKRWNVREDVGSPYTRRNVE